MLHTFHHIFIATILETDNSITVCKEKVNILYKRELNINREHKQVTDKKIGNII